MVWPKRTTIILFHPDACWVITTKLLNSNISGCCDLGSRHTDPSCQHWGAQDFVTSPPCYNIHSLTFVRLFLIKNVPVWQRPTTLRCSKLELCNFSHLIHSLIFVSLILILKNLGSRHTDPCCQYWGAQNLNFVIFPTSYNIHSVIFVTLILIKKICPSMA